MNATVKSIRDALVENDEDHNSFQLLMWAIHVNVSRPKFRINQEYRLIMHHSDGGVIKEWFDKGYVDNVSAMKNDANMMIHVKLYLTQKAVDIRAFYNL